MVKRAYAQHSEVLSNPGNRRVALAFGRVLRETRLSKDLTQDHLAAICDFHRTYPSLLERGLRSPTLAMLLRISAALEVAAAELVNKTQDELRAL
jgi:XRE family transcriptional regulator, regulator of sulfur utilization